MTFDLNTLQVGQEVAVGSAGTWKSRFTFGYRVKSITPKRTKIVVARESDGYERAFSAKGQELGTDGSWYCAIHTNVAELRAWTDFETKRDALAHEVRNLGNTKIDLGHAPGSSDIGETLDKLEAAIAAARTKLAEVAVLEAAARAVATRL